LNDEELQLQSNDQDDVPNVIRVYQLRVCRLLIRSTLSSQTGVATGGLIKTMQSAVK